MIGIGLNVVLSQHTISDLLTQAGETLSGRILQSSTATFLQNCHRGFHNLLNGEQLGSGHTAGERHDLGTACQLQQLTDSRALQQVHSTCKLYHKLFPPENISFQLCVCCPHKDPNYFIIKPHFFLKVNIRF